MSVETHNTPWTDSKAEGTYVITIPLSVQVDVDIYDFQSWEDLSTNPTRTVNLVGDLAVMATYQLRPILTHALTVDSTPVTGVPFTIEKV